MAGRNIYLTDKAGGRPRRRRSSVAQNASRCAGHSRESLPSRSSRTPSRIPPRFVASSTAPTRWLPRSTCGLATSWFWTWDHLKTSGKLRRANSVNPVTSVSLSRRKSPTRRLRGILRSLTRSLPGGRGLRGLHAPASISSSVASAACSQIGTWRSVSKVLQHKRRRVLWPGGRLIPIRTRVKVFGTQRPPPSATC